MKRRDFVKAGALLLPGWLAKSAQAVVRVPGPGGSPAGGGSAPPVGYTVWLKKSGASGSTWTDASGNSNSATLYGSPTINGTGTVTFNPASSQYAQTAGPASALQPWTVGFRAKRLGYTAYTYLLCSATSNSGLQDDGSTTNDLNLYAGSPNLGPITVPQDGAFHTIVAVANGASSVLNLDSGTDVSGSTGTSDISNGQRLCSAYGTPAQFGYWEIAEYIFYPSALSPTDRSTLETYLTGVI